MSGKRSGSILNILFTKLHLLRDAGFYFLFACDFSPRKVRINAALRILIVFVTQTNASYLKIFVKSVSSPS